MSPRAACLLLVTAWACWMQVYAQQLDFKPFSQIPFPDPNVHLHPKKAITADVSAFAEDIRNKTGVHGLSVAVVRLENDSVLTEFGTWGNRTEDGDAVQEDTLFSIGSTSKAFLVGAMGILMDDFANDRNVTALPPGITSFTWDTKLHQLLPEDWKLMDDFASEKASIRDILGHVSGLTRHDLSYTRSDTPLATIRRLRYLKPGYEFREKFSYNNLMYMAASHVITTYAKKPFREFVKERIFVPLNMTSTTYSGEEAAASGLLSQSWSSTGRRIPYWFAGENVSHLIAGAGGILSNAIDMSKWAAMLLNSGIDPYTNRTVLPLAVFHEMTTARFIVTGRPRNPLVSVSAYAMGWLRFSYQGHDVVEHTGGLPGFLTEIFFLPADNIAVVAFANSEGTGVAQAAVPARIIEDYLGLERSAGEPLYESAKLHHSTGLPFQASSISGIPSAWQQCDNVASEHTMVPSARFEGVYSNPGYGNITLCAPHSKDTACAAVLTAFASISANGTLDPQAVYLATSRILTDHGRMRRTCSAPGMETFRLSAGTVFPHGFGLDTTPFLYSLMQEDSVVVECVSEGDPAQVVGCGLMNSEDGPTITEGSVPERADVWFSKMQQ